jgi:phage terminase small subunit
MAVTSLLRIDPHNPYAQELEILRRRMTPQEIRFVEELQVDLDHERAARAAKLDPKQGRGFANRWYVKEALTLLNLERSERLSVSADKVVQEYAKLAFANMGDYVQETADGEPIVSLKGVDRDRRAAISEMTVEDFVDGRGENAREVRRVKVKLHDKKSALDSVARHLGMFVDRVEHSGEIGMRLKNMTRAERLQLMMTLLEPMQKYLTKEELEDPDCSIEGVATEVKDDGQ